MAKYRIGRASRIVRVVTGDGGEYATIREAHAAHAHEYYGRGAIVVRRDGTIETRCVGGEWPARVRRVAAIEGPRAPIGGAS
jgi:hypothetical protein